MPNEFRKSSTNEIRKKKIYIKLKTKVGKPSAWKSYNFLCEDFQKLQNMTNMNVRRR